MPKYAVNQDCGRTAIQRDIEGDGICTDKGDFAEFTEITVSSPEPGMVGYNSATNQKDPEIGLHGKIDED